MPANITPVIPPSGEGIAFVFADSITGLDSLVTNVVDNNELQSVTISGRPSGGTFTLTYGGQTTAPITAIPVPPPRYCRYDFTLPSSGTYTFAANKRLGGQSGPLQLYEFFDGGTLAGTTHFNGQGSGNAGGPTNPAPFADATLIYVNTGLPIQWYPIGTFAFTGTAAGIRLSCAPDPIADNERFDADDILILNSGGTVVARLQPDETAGGPLTIVAQNFDYGGPGRGAQGFEPVGDTHHAVEIDGVAAGTQYTADPAAVLSALAALSSVGAGNVTINGSGPPYDPITVKFVNALGNAARPLLTTTDSAVSIRELAPGGTLPSIRVNGGSPVALPRDWMYCNLLTAAMPTVQFFFPQPPPVATYAIFLNSPNRFAWGSNHNGDDHEDRWLLGVAGGYSPQAQYAVGPASTATWNFTPAGAGQFRVSATWPAASDQTTDAVYTIRTVPYLVCPPVASNGSTQSVSGVIRPISRPTTLTASAIGNGGSVRAVSVTVYGADASGNPVSETLPPFTAGTTGTVSGSTVFSSVSSVTMPAHNKKDASTTVYAAPVTLGVYHADQSAAPSGSVDRGVPWRVLGTYDFTGLNDGLVVTLANGTSSKIVADAVRFERLSPDTSLRIAPSDTVTASWGAGWASCRAGTAGAGNAVAATNKAGGVLYPPPPTTATMKVGWNVPQINTQVASYIYQNVANQAGGLGDYPTTSSIPSIYANLTTTPQAYGGEGKNLANVPNGDYVLLWDSLDGVNPATDTRLSASAGTVTETGTAVTGQLHNNRRNYTLGGDIIHYGASLDWILNGVSDGAGAYRYNAGNLRIYPAGTDLANPPKYLANHIARMSKQVARWVDPLGTLTGNPSTYADYQKSQALVSRNVAPRSLSVPIAEIRQYNGSVVGLAGASGPLDPTVGVAFLVTTPTPHGLDLFHLGSFQGFSGPPAQLQDNLGNTTTFGFDGVFGFTFVLSSTTFVFFQGPHAPSDSSAGYRMTNVLTNPAGSFQLVAGNGMPLQDMVEQSNLAGGLDFYFNTAFCATQDALERCATYLAQNLAPGAKLRVECSNETWNVGFAVYNLASNASYAFYGGGSSDFVPFTCEMAQVHWGWMKAKWVAAGRAPGDFLRVAGSIHGDTGCTRRVAEYCHPRGYTFDELATGPYLASTAGLPRGPDVEAGFAATIDRMSVDQHLDMLEIHFVHGDYEGEYNSHRSELDKFAEFRSVALIAYEGGPADFVLPGGSGNNHTYLNHALIRHPRCYGPMLHMLRIRQDSGCVAFHQFELTSIDQGDGILWPAYLGTDMADYAPGDATQDAIQINTPERVDLVKSVDGGALTAFSRLYGAAATPDFTLSATGTTVTQGGTATVTVTLSALNSFTGTVTLGNAGLPAGVTGSFSPTSLTGGGTTTATLTLTASGSATVGTSSPTVTGVDSADSLSHSAGYALTVAASGGGGQTASVVGVPVNLVMGFRRVRGM